MVLQLRKNLVFGKRVLAEAVLHVDSLLLAGIRVQSGSGPAFAELRSKHRESYCGSKDEQKCQRDGCYHTVILMEFKGSKILECPLHLQQRLGDVPAVAADDPMSFRLPRKKQAKEELGDQVRAQKILTPPKRVKVNVDEIGQPCRSDSSDSSYGKQHRLVSVHSDDEDSREAPVPSSPLRENVT